MPTRTLTLILAQGKVCCANPNPNPNPNPKPNQVLLTPQPRLRTGFFSTLSVADNLRAGDQLDQLTNSKGVAKYGTQVSLDAEYTVDLVVVGSTAVCPTSGARVGKGEGFAELEWGILSLQG